MSFLNTNVFALRCREKIHEAIIINGKGLYIFWLSSILL